MSLLIDALRKAEQARREGEFQSQAQPAEGSELGLAPLEVAGAPTPIAPEVGQGAFVDDPFGDRPRGPEPSPAAARATARNLFEVKQAPPRRLFWPVVGGMTTLAVLALGGYLWWELQPRGISTPMQSAAPRPAPPPAATLAVASPAPAREVAAIPAPPPPEVRPPAMPAPARGSFTPPPPAKPAADSLGAIRKGEPQDERVPRAVAAAYAAYNQGDLDRATALYREALAQDGLNRDGLNGLAAVALRQGREGEAEGWFRRALQADPTDPVALAGLADLRARANPAQGETAMKSLVAARPDAAPGHFALGNALAAQGRWGEAQQAYFQAHALDPGNPDYLFNLAVSLDRLNQAPLARRFYGEALAAATKRAASFDQAAAQTRQHALAEAR